MKIQIVTHKSRFICQRLVCSNIMNIPGLLVMLWSIVPDGYKSLCFTADYTREGIDLIENYEKIKIGVTFS